MKKGQCLVLIFYNLPFKWVTLVFWPPAADPENPRGPSTAGGIMGVCRHYTIRCCADVGLVAEPAKAKWQQSDAMAWPKARPRQTKCCNLHPLSAPFSADSKWLTRNGGATLNIIVTFKWQIAGRSVIIIICCSRIRTFANWFRFTRPRSYAKYLVFTQCIRGCSARSPGHGK